MKYIVIILILLLLLTSMAGAYMKYNPQTARYEETSGERYDHNTARYVETDTQEKPANRFAY